MIYCNHLARGCQGKKVRLFAPKIKEEHRKQYPRMEQMQFSNHWGRILAAAPAPTMALTAVATAAKCRWSGPMMAEVISQVIRVGFKLADKAGRDLEELGIARPKHKSFSRARMRRAYEKMRRDNEKAAAKLKAAAEKAKAKATNT